MKDNIKTALVIVGLIVFAIAFFYIFTGIKTPLCQEKFGIEAKGNVGNVGTPDCVMPDGRGKYL